MVWNIVIIFFHILGRIIPTDFHIFQRGWNHQLDYLNRNLLFLIFWSYPLITWNFAIKHVDYYPEYPVGRKLKAENVLISFWYLPVMCIVKRSPPVLWHPMFASKKTVLLDQFSSIPPSFQRSSIISPPFVLDQPWMDSLESFNLSFNCVLSLGIYIYNYIYTNQH